MTEDYPKITEDSKCFYCHKNIFSETERVYTNCCCGCEAVYTGVHICYFDVDLLEIKQFEAEGYDNVMCPLPGCNQLIVEIHQGEGTECCGCLYNFSEANEHSHK